VNQLYYSLKEWFAILEALKKAIVSLLRLVLNWQKFYFSKTTPHYKNGKRKETYIFIVYITFNITSDGLLVFLTMNQQLLEIIKIDLILDFKKENNFKLIS